MSRIINFLRRAVNKPYYIFRPKHVMVRLLHSDSSYVDADGFEEAILPWKAKIRFRSSDLIGQDIKQMGLYDLCVCETIWRLLDIGETALDVGANIGQMTSEMACRVGKSGRVFSFEPQPDVFQELQDNVNRWQKNAKYGHIIAQDVALSDASGVGTLCNQMEHFTQNRMVARLTTTSEQPHGREEVFHSVKLERIDDLFSEHGEIGLLKIDVEGHELQVFQGAAGLLNAHRIRDIIFEEWDDYPTDVTNFLEGAGYSIFTLKQEIFGLLVFPADKRNANRGYPPNYLATINPDRAISRMRKKGWGVFGFGPF